MQAEIRLSDPTTIEAIGILAGVLDDITGPERLECLMAANALRQVVETKSETALSFARSAFESLDGPVRRDIQTKANGNAAKVAAAKRPARKQGKQAGAKATGGILDAINRGGMSTERKW